MKTISHAILIKSIVLMFIFGASQIISAAESWQFVSKNSFPQQAYASGFFDAENGVTVGYGGACFFSSNGGADWKPAENKSMCRYTLDYADKDTVWNAGNAEHVRLSLDSGKTWQKVSDCGLIGRFISFVNGKKGYIASEWDIVSTTDSGKTWQKLSSPTMSIDGISSADDSSVFIIDDKSNIFISNDNGKKWRKQTVKGMEKLAPKTKTVRFFNSQKGIIFGYEKNEKKMVSFETENGGKSWKKEIISDAFGKPYISPNGKTLTIFNLDKQVSVYTR